MQALVAVALAELHALERETSACTARLQSRDHDYRQSPPPLLVDCVIECSGPTTRVDALKCGGPTMRVDAVHRPRGYDLEWLQSSAPRNFWNQPLEPRRHYKSSRVA